MLSGQWLNGVCRTKNLQLGRFHGRSPGGDNLGPGLATGSVPWALLALQLGLLGLQLGLLGLQLGLLGLQLGPFLETGSIPCS